MYLLASWRQLANSCSTYTATHDACGDVHCFEVCRMDGRVAGVVVSSTAAPTHRLVGFMVHHEGDVLGARCRGRACPTTRLAPTLPLPAAGGQKLPVDARHARGSRLAQGRLPACDAGAAASYPRRPWPCIPQSGSSCCAHVTSYGAAGGCHGGLLYACLAAPPGLPGHGGAADEASNAAAEPRAVACSRRPLGPWVAAASSAQPLGFFPLCNRTQLPHTARWARYHTAPTRALAAERPGQHIHHTAHAMQADVRTVM
jgi:hypothetical protein